MTTQRQILTHAPPGPVNGLLAGWQEAVHHPLMSVYLQLPRHTLPPRLARRAVIGLWALWLLGTALAVILYPQATDEVCTQIYSMTYCGLPLSGISNPLHGFNLWASRLVIFSLLVLPPVLFVGALLVTFISGLRGKRPYSRQPNRLTLAIAWGTGLIEALMITPLRPATLLRVRVLSRLYTAWRFRAWAALGLGALAAVGVSNAVVVPSYPELGGWGNWLAQLGQVALWAVALAAWMAALSVFAVLNEITQGSQQVFPGVGWSSLAAGQFVVMTTMPLLLVMHLGVRLQPISRQEMLLPLILALMGAVMTGLNYVVAQIVFHLRLRGLRR